MSNHYRITFPLPSRYGFTLVELAVVLVVIALITGMGMVSTLGTLEAARRAQTQAKLDVIEKTLAAFREQYNRLPCPGDITLTHNSGYYGLEAANSGRCLGGSPAASDISGNGANYPEETKLPPVVQGGVPARTLNLPDEYMFDGWGRRFLYAVDANATAANAFDFIPVSADSCGLGVMDGGTGYRSGGKYPEAYYDSNGNGSYTSGETYSDTDGDGAYDSSSAGGGAIYVLLSHGSNGHGAYINGSTRLSVGSTNTAELNNCNCTATGASGTVNPSFVQKEASENPSTPTDVFDDMVRFKERWQLQNDADRADTRGNRRCQMIVGIKDASETDHDPVICYKRGCDGWVVPTTTYLATPSSSNIANLFFAPDNSYIHALFTRTTGSGCSVPSFGVCAVPLDVSNPSGYATFYCSYSCGDGSNPQFSLSNNGYFGMANVEGVTLQLFRLSGASFNQLDTATAITPAITSHTNELTNFTFSRNAEYFIASDWMNWGIFTIYKKYDSEIFQEIHDSKYPLDLPDANTGDPAFDGDGTNIWMAIISNDNRFLAVADFLNYEVLIYEIGAGNPFIAGGTNPFGSPIETISTTYFPESLAFSPDGQYFAVGTMAAAEGGGEDINEAVAIYKIDTTVDPPTFTAITIAAGDPNVFYNNAGSHTPGKLLFTADSKTLLVVTDDEDAGIVTLDRVNATTFEQRIPRAMGGTYQNTVISILN